MAAGTRVSSTTEMKDFQVRMDRVLTHAQGSSAVRDRQGGMDGMVVQVTVRAFIGTAELDKDLEAMACSWAQGMPRTMVLIAEQNIACAPRATWMRDRMRSCPPICASPNHRARGAQERRIRQLIDPEVAAIRRCRWRDRQRDHQRPGGRLKSLTARR